MGGTQVTKAVDVAQRLLQTTSVTPVGGSAVPMTYAGSGQTARVSAGGTTYVYDLRGMASETTSGTTTRYVRDPSGSLLGERIGSAVYYYLYDGLGSVIGLTNSSGTLVNTYAYDLYGNVTASTGRTPNRWKFAGGYQDATTGLIKFGQRYYDPTLGRWTQTDPAGVDPSSPGAASSYTYADGDPVNNVDLTGAKARPFWKVQGKRRTSGAAYTSRPPAVQFDCGWISCTIRFNRATTQSIASGASGIAGLTALCVTAVPWAAPVCGPIALAAVGAAAIAQIIYLTGNCLGIRVWPSFLLAAPVVVQRDSYNCG